MAAEQRSRRVQQLVKRGILPRGKRGQYELLPCLHAYIGHLKKQLQRFVNASLGNRTFPVKDDPAGASNPDDRAEISALYLWEELNEEDIEETISNGTLTETGESSRGPARMRGQF